MSTELVRLKRLAEETPFDWEQWRKEWKNFFRALFGMSMQLYAGITIIMPEVSWVYTVALLVVGWLLVPDDYRLYDN